MWPGRRMPQFTPLSPDPQDTVVIDSGNPSSDTPVATAAWQVMMTAPELGAEESQADPAATPD
eukprot:9070966-Prorocentrum_lima.AAC.1